ncbi:serine hydrolase, partial [Streptomyces eurythermus]
AGDALIVSYGAIGRDENAHGPTAGSFDITRETEIGLGLWLSGPRGLYGPNPRAFGHDGFGGSCGLADPEAGVSLGYVMNRMGHRLADDPRKTALVDALYRAL